MRDLRVVQTLSAGHGLDRAVRAGRGRRSATRAARATSRWPSGSSARCSARRPGCSAGARRSTWAYAPQPELARLDGAHPRPRLDRPGGRAAPGAVRRRGRRRRARSRLDELPELLPRTDALVVLAPLTDDTRGMVDAAMLARLPDGALVLNAGRGAVVDTDALVAELRSRSPARGARRHRARAAARRPPAVGARRWRSRRTTRGDSAAAEERAIALAAEQLARYARGEELVNVVLAAGR